MTSPYIDTTLTSSVVLSADKLNKNLYQNLLNRLIANNVGFCNKECYIIKIYKITEYSDGIIRKEDLNCSPLFDVEFACRVCKPIRWMNITAKINVINDDFIKLVNGPINIFVSIKLARYDQTNFTVNKKGFVIDKESKKILEKGDYIDIKLTQVKLTSGDTDIYCIGFMNRLSTNSEIDIFLEDVKKNTDINKFINPKKVNIYKNENKIDYKEENNDEKE